MMRHTLVLMACFTAFAFGCGTGEAQQERSTIMGRARDESAPSNGTKDDSRPTNRTYQKDGNVRVATSRAPGGGIQPQAAVAGDGTLHLIYFRGKPASGDLFYVRRVPGEEAWSKSIRVNHVAGSAIATGTIRGGQLSIGRNGFVHVVWNGSKAAEPRGPEGQTPLLYTRMSPGSEEFERERNIVTKAWGLDGGGSVAADDEGHVCIVWHAGTTGEEERSVFVARSTDDGRTFSPESEAWAERTGACGCCSLKAFAGSGRFHVLYRAAKGGVDRDMYLLSSTDSGATFTGRRVDQWNANICPMSSESFTVGPNGIVAAWESKNGVYFTTIDSKTGKFGRVHAPPGKGARKHPSLAADREGRILLAWAEGTGWNKGGTLGWQLFDADGTTLESGRAEGLPVWSLPSAVYLPGDGFRVFH